MAETYIKWHTWWEHKIGKTRIVITLEWPRD